MLPLHEIQVRKIHLALKHFSFWAGKWEWMLLILVNPAIKQFDNLVKKSFDLSPCTNVQINILHSVVEVVHSNAGCFGRTRLRHPAAGFSKLVKLIHKIL